MNFFRLIGFKNLSKAFDNTNEKINCSCSDANGFYLTKRQASIATSIMIFLLTFMLVIGYLWGQRSSIKEFTSKVMNDSFADQVNYSMYSMYGEAATTEDYSEKEDLIEENKSEIKNKAEINSKPNTTPVSNLNLPNTKDVATVSLQKSQTSQNDPSVKHYAQLVGYGLKANAEKFINKLQKKGYTLHLREIKSKSKKKTLTWYQVVTDEFNDKAQLEKVVGDIKKDGNLLNDIKFITTKN